MVVSCPERVSVPRRGSSLRRSFRQSDRLWSVRCRQQARRSRSLDDLRFSNSMTVEHNVLGPGSIGHLLRNCTYSTTTHARTDHWYHYDQVGSVVCESSNTPIPSISHRYADAWGNTMSSYTTGEWTSTWASRDGWGHNTKEYDGDSGLVYMYQRWYQPELGVFMCQAPYPPMIESEYIFSAVNPVSRSDVSGSLSMKQVGRAAAKGAKRVARNASNGVSCCATEAAKKAAKYGDAVGDRRNGHKMRHCMANCLLAKCVGPGSNLTQTMYEIKSLADGTHGRSGHYDWFIDTVGDEIAGHAGGAIGGAFFLLPKDMHEAMCLGSCLGIGSADPGWGMPPSGGWSF